MNRYSRIHKKYKIVINVIDISLALFILAIPMMPVFTIYGFYLSGVLVTLCFFIMLISGEKIELTKFDIIYLLFTIYNIISLIWSVSERMTVIKLQLIYYIFLFSFSKLLLIKNRDVEKAVEFWMKWYIFGTILISVICLILEWPGYMGSVRLGKYVFEEPYGTFMMFSYSLEIAVFMLIYLFFKKKKVAYIFLLGFVCGCIILNGTRKIFLGVILFYLAYGFYIDKGRFIKIIRRLSVVIVMVGITYLVMMNNVFLYNSYGYRIEAFLNFASTGTGDISVSARNSMIEYALKYFRERPLLGWGSHSFSFLYNKDTGINLYSHNTFVELLCDLGLTGFLMYYSFYVYSIKKLVKNSIEYFSPVASFFFAILITLLILDYWTISYFRIQFLMVLSIAGLYLNYFERRNVIN